MGYLTNGLKKLRRTGHKRRSGASARERHENRLDIERLEERTLMAGFNDPDYSTLQWGLDNVGQNGGTYDVDIDAPEAWTVTTGSMKTLVAELDSGVPYNHPDIYLNIWLNQAEIPVALRANLSDMDGDGIISFRDLNNSANAGSVSDLNGTGYIDGGDLLQDSRWANGGDDGTNGQVDDLVGWDFVDNDNDPMPVSNDDHGQRMTQWIGAIPNNGVGYVGVNWFVSVMPIRIIPPGTRDFDPQTGAAGLDYAVASGAPIAGLWGGGYTYSEVLYDAIDRARLAGQLVVAPIGNDATNTDVTPRYPASYDLDNIVSVTSFNPYDAMDAAWNWGLTTVDLASPTTPGGGTSGGAANVAAVAALLNTTHPEWNYQELKSRILSTVEPSIALAGKCVTGGRLNAANALGYTWSPTKFYVVNGATYSQTYEYQATNQFITANRLGNGNSSPRGVASNVGGDKVWVADANRKVYVYNNTGTLLSSWTAGSLSSTAQVEGIATNGADVWIVDAKSDRVYTYTGAASQPSGSTKSANGSFSLNSGNRNPKDIVTDGTYLYVVNDSTIDKVFKYTFTGSLVASWTISTAGASSPTGITLDPANPSHLWIVDNGADRVYEYANAVSQANGSSKSADASFALASGNTNPQGIADPPVAAGTSTGQSAASAAGPVRAELFDAAILAAMRPMRDDTVELLASARFAGAVDRSSFDANPAGSPAFAYHAARGEALAATVASGQPGLSKRHAVRSTTVRTSEPTDRVLEAWSLDEDDLPTPTQKGTVVFS